MPNTFFLNRIEIATLNTKAESVEPSIRNYNEAIAAGKDEIAKTLASEIFYAREVIRQAALIYRLNRAANIFKIVFACCAIAAGYHLCTRGDAPTAKTLGLFAISSGFIPVTLTAAKKLFQSATAKSYERRREEFISQIAKSKPAI